MALLLLVLAGGLLVTGGSVFAQQGDEANLTITDIQADASGDDSENLNGESVTILVERGGRSLDEIENASEVNVSGYTLDYGDEGQVYDIEANTVPLGTQFAISTGGGTDLVEASFPPTYLLHANFSEPVLNNEGDTVTLRDADGNVVDQVTYGNANDSDGKSTDLPDTCGTAVTLENLSNASQEEFETALDEGELVRKGNDEEFAIDDEIPDVDDEIFNETCIRFEGSLHYARLGAIRDGEAFQLTIELVSDEPMSPMTTTVDTDTDTTTTTADTTTTETTTSVPTDTIATDTTTDTDTADTTASTPTEDGDDGKAKQPSDDDAGDGDDGGKAKQGGNGKAKMS